MAQENKNFFYYGQLFKYYFSLYACLISIEMIKLPMDIRLYFRLFKQTDLIHICLFSKEVNECLFYVQDNIENVPLQ